MSSTACLPITALHILGVEGRRLLVAGSGSTLRIYDINGGHEVLSSQSVFSCQAIHGIVSGGLERSATTSSVLICAWGGKQLCLGKLEVPLIGADNDAVDINLDLQPAVDAGDWILDAIFDVTTSMIVLLTAHNNLKVVRDVTSHQQQISNLCDGPQTLLYSGHVLSTSADSFLVASGTVFGETVVWTCFKEGAHDAWRSYISHLFLGHQGSVFGVRLSQPIHFQGTTRRLLASCSDDRTIRVWDVSNCDPTTSSRKAEAEAHGRETGFGVMHTQISELTMAWGHLSRIWSVHFPDTSLDPSEDLLELYSCGEDGVYQTWSINLEKLFKGRTDGATVMQKTSHDRHHTGKNIWSYARGIVNGNAVVFTGGADGQIVARSQYNGDEPSRSQVEFPFQQIFESLSRYAVSQPGKVSPTARSIKQYLSCSDGTIVATTDSGRLLMSRANDWDQWYTVDDDAAGSAITLCSNQCGNLVFYSRLDGSLNALDTLDRKTIEFGHLLPSQCSWKRVVYSTDDRQDGSRQIYLFVSLMNRASQLLIINTTTNGTTIKQCSLRAPADFLTTSVLFDLSNNTLICGSRAGALAVFTRVSDQSTEISSNYCQRRVHGSDAVTSIIKLSTVATRKEDDRTFILTTGRDGTLLCHAMICDRNRMTVRMNTVHRIHPPLGPYIEGAYFTRREDGRSALLLYGFKSKDFVVWDETNQTNLLSIDCGGAHRNWTYTPSVVQDEVGTFIWTKAGSFNACKQGVVEHHSPRLGSHGREIKALAISAVSTSPTGKPCQETRTVATGAEDTDIRIFKYSPGTTPGTQADLSSTAILKGHNTGLQHLIFSPCGRFLFSSAGCEEFFVWRLHDIPILTVGAVLVAKLSREPHQSESVVKGKHDARITSFDIAEVSSGHGEKTEFNILMAYSNGEAKLAAFTYDSIDDTATLKVINGHTAGSICLTQAHIVLSQQQYLIGATDGFLRFLKAEAMEDQAVTHKVHQSSIISLAVQDLTPQTKLIATGGDDNAFGVTVVDYSTKSTKTQMRTILVPDAHAAALTAVVVVQHTVRNGHSLVLIVTAGNDQRVKLWLVTSRSLSERQSALTTDSARGNQLQIRDERWTDVADISSIGVISMQEPDEEGILHFEVLVLGVGMEVLRFAVPSP